MSTNVAYKDVAKEKEEEYENIETILKSSGQWTEDNTIKASAKSVASKPAASEYTDRDDTVFVVRQPL